VKPAAGQTTARPVAAPKSATASNATACTRWYSTAVAQTSSCEGSRRALSAWAPKAPSTTPRAPNRAATMVHMRRPCLGTQRSQGCSPRKGLISPDGLAAGITLVVLYPVCIGFRALKRRHPKSVLQYI